MNFTFICHNIVFALCIHALVPWIMMLETALMACQQTAAGELLKITGFVDEYWL